jgi:hypothetical protein
MYAHSRCGLTYQDKSQRPETVAHVQLANLTVTHLLAITAAYIICSHCKQIMDQSTFKNVLLPC